MGNFGKVTPALNWRAFFVFLSSVLPGFAALPANPLPPDLPQFARATPAEAQKMLEDFQKGMIAGQYYLEFDLRVLPRRGEEQTLRGKLWGGQNEQGAITRVAVTDAAGRESRFLLQNGPRAAAWNWVDGRFGQLAPEALFQPLVTGVEIAPFDLQMPFLFWPDFVVENLVRIGNRPTQALFFRPPEAFLKQYGGISGARAYLDTQYSAPVKTELIAADGRLVKTLWLVDLKRIGNRTIVKTIDVRNDTTGDKTRFQVTAAALDLELSPSIFQPATLSEDVRPPSSDRLTRLDR